MLSSRARPNPSPVMPTYESIMAIVDRMGSQDGALLGWITDHDQLVEIVKSWLEYIQAALQALPSDALVPWLNCESNFAIPGFDFDQWRITFVWIDDEAMDYEEKWKDSPTYVPKNGQIITAENENGYYQERAQIGRCYIVNSFRMPDAPLAQPLYRVDEPAYITHHDVMTRGGRMAADEMMASGVWTYPTTERGTIPIKRQTRPFRKGKKKRPPKFMGIWQFIGRDNPSWKEPSDRDWWLPKRWKRDKTVGRRHNPHDFSDRDLDAVLEGVEDDFGEAGARIARLFEDLIESAPEGTFTGPLRLVIDEKTALAGRPADSRAHACCGLDLVGLDEGTNSCTVFIAPKLVEPEKPLPGSRSERAQALALAHRQRGILMHELAHASLLQHGDDTHTERDADALAEELWGHTVFYDEEGVQTTGHGVSPRPREYDRKKNPGQRNGRSKEDC